jgi:hypothetical protein
LFSTQMFGIKLGLDGRAPPAQGIPRFPAHGTQVIHVAGTNGKGSTCAMIDSIARACGRRSGLFTSPHLIDFRERIQVSGANPGGKLCRDAQRAAADLRADGAASRRFSRSRWRWRCAGSASAAAN